MNYECNIAVDLKDAHQATQVAILLKWKISEIARDPVLGDRNFFYLITHANTEREIFARMWNCERVLLDNKIKLLRKKVARIIFDECPE